MSRFMIYGANGYTGRLIARNAAAHGLKPLLAGRSREALDTLAGELGLHRRLFALVGPKSIEGSLDDVELVLNCAGPFSETCKPLLEACLARGVHYLDITGEIDVFAWCHAQHERARERSVVVAPGVGFDVVPTDSLAALLKQRLPRADELLLAFEATGGMSPGTARTGVEGLSAGGRIRLRGELAEVPLAWKVRSFERDGQPRTAVTVPWGDVYTAYVSTRIPNIETYMVLPPAMIRRMRWLRWARPLLRLPAVEAFAKRRVGAGRGPSAERRARSGCYVWGEVRAADGSEAKLALRTPNSYALTAETALGIVAHVLATRPAGGYYTPSQLMGADWVLSLPGVQLIDAAPASAGS